jgi:hypothetical protein
MEPAIEQDRNLPIGADDLPTYDDLAAQAGPNSRRVIFLASYTPPNWTQVRAMARMDREARGGTI